ncbi:hypothetical protein FS837_008042 [Tulasnella sp. UAMH 9824]|nr:hypothetical protein FS837_008042 [Tulasnella sp. UAMH 9824]
MATSSRTRLCQGEESDPAQCPSDVSMDDDEKMDKHSPPVRMNGIKGYSHGQLKTNGQFMGRLKEMIKKETEHIRWNDKGLNAILIPGIGELVAKALSIHFLDIKDVEGTLWVRKNAPQPNDPTSQGRLPELASTASAPVAASVALGLLEQTDLAARMDVFQNDLAATMSELEKTRVLLSETERELQTTNAMLQRVLRMLEAFSTGDSLNSVANHGQGAVAFQDYPQMNQAGGYGGIPDGLSLKTQIVSYGIQAPQGVPFDTEVGTLCNSFDPALLAGQPVHHQSSCHGSETSNGFPQTCPSGQHPHGGSFSQLCLIQQRDFTNMRQLSSTSFGHPPFHHYASPVARLPAIFAPPARLLPNPQLFPEL